MLAEEELVQQGGVQQAVDWLKKQAGARHIILEIRLDQIEERHSDYYTHIIVPVEMPALETDEFLDTLGEFQSRWNNREPRPGKLLFLYPAGAPRHAV